MSAMFLCDVCQDCDMRDCNECSEGLCDQPKPRTHPNCMIGKGNA